ncbi:unnamed protein product [Nezara viridula]|uniref:EF-hand domain-containing protein n=1 Tax=Nezara viridula TaxID=85310 RepID=A0A9P0MS27_NEZVI|nr:unnamed protein product [Nezara viridula]
MMLIGKTLLRAGLRLACPTKYIYPTINNVKYCCIASKLPFDTHYSECDLLIMKNNFDEEDEDRDECINMFQFNHFIRRTMGRSLDSRELYCLFAEIDKDCNGLLSLGDIVCHFEKQFKPQEEHRMKEVFCLYDKDEDGKVKLHELREILFHLGFFISRSKCLEDFFEKRDPKNIRKIDYEEFKKLMKEDIPHLINQ